VSNIGNCGGELNLELSELVNKFIDTVLWVVVRTRHLDTAGGRREHQMLEVKINSL
jgi:hypothetical protein